MAEAIDFTPRPADQKDLLTRKLREAPLVHASALLDAYAVLELLQKNGMLEIAKTSLGSGDTLVELLAEIVERKEVVALSRNLTILIKMVGGARPEILESVQSSLTASSKKNWFPYFDFLRVLFAIFRPSFWRGLGAIVRAIAAFGANLSEDSLGDEPRLRRRVYRHEIHED